MRAPPRAGNKSVWLITPLALHQKPRGGWVLQQRHPVFVIGFYHFYIIKKTLTTTGIEPVCCFCKQQSNVVAYLRWREEAVEDAPGPAHDKKTGARARDNILDTHKGRERYGEIRRDTEEDKECTKNHTL